MADIQVQWNENFLPNMLRSPTMMRVMSKETDRIAAQVNGLAAHGARYGHKIAKGRAGFWKGRIYTANIQAIRQNHKYNTLVKGMYK